MPGTFGRKQAQLEDDDTQAVTAIFLAVVPKLYLKISWVQSHENNCEIQAYDPLRVHVVVDFVAGNKQNGEAL